MIKKELICVICPNGCELAVEAQETQEGLRLLEIKGNLCKKGPRWAEKELIAPLRTISSSILVEGGELPLVSVRTHGPIPLDRIFDVMEDIKKTRVKAPVSIGQVLIANPGGTRTKIIATKTVKARDWQDSPT